VVLHLSIVILNDRSKGSCKRKKEREKIRKESEKNRQPADQCSPKVEFIQAFGISERAAMCKHVYAFARVAQVRR
jgi:hypothetical protein